MRVGRQIAYNTGIPLSEEPQVAVVLHLLLSHRHADEVTIVVDCGQHRDLDVPGQLSEPADSAGFVCHDLPFRIDFTVSFIPRFDSIQMRGNPREQIPPTWSPVGMP